MTETLLFPVSVVGSWTRPPWLVQALRRRQASETVERLFAILELQSRVPTSLLASVMVAFVDGLALDFAARREHGDQESSSPRVAFDVFWLAMLSLAE